MIKDEIIQKLKDARESRQISLQDASRILSIRVQVLQDLEDGCYNRLGALIYVKSYIRKYADFLKISRDEIDPLLAQLEDPFNYEKNDSVIRAQMNDDKRMVQRSFFRWYSVILAVLLFAGLCLYFVYGEKVADIFHVRPTPDQTISANEEVSQNVIEPQEAVEVVAIVEEQEDELPTSIATDIPESEQAIENITSPVNTNIIQATDTDSILTEFEVDQILRSANIDLSNLESNSVDEETEKAPLPEGVSALTITLNNSECWIQIRDKDQKVIMNEVLPANATYHLEGAAPFSLHVGNATSIAKLELNGELVDEKIYRPTSRTIVSKFKLSPKEEN